MTSTRCIYRSQMVGLLEFKISALIMCIFVLLEFIGKEVQVFLVLLDFMYLFIYKLLQFLINLLYDSKYKLKKSKSDKL